MQPIDLNPHDLDIVRAILRKFVPDRAVWAFGSRTKWTAKPFSDLDLAIVGDQSLPISVVADLTDAFDESELPIKVDVVDWATTSESFRKIIQKDRVVVQEKIKGSAVSPEPTFSTGNGGLSQMDCKELGWLTKTLGELAEITSSKRIFASDYVTAGIPFFRGKEIVEKAGGQTKVKVEIFISVDKFESIKAKFGAPIEGDILLTSVGTIGTSYRVNNNETFYFKDGNLTWFRNFERCVDSLFLSFWLKSPIAQRTFNEVAIGSSQKALTIENLKKIRICLPSLSDQVAIAKVMASFDDMSSCLISKLAISQELAQATFESWFVKFEPVRAKMNGCSPFGMDKSTTKLFPDGLVDSDFGEIPIGWTVTTLADIVSERASKVGDGNEHVVLSAVASGELKRSDEHFTKQVHSQDTSKYKSVEQWDFAYNPSRINIGSIGMLEEPIVGAVSPVYTVLRPTQGYEWFLRFFLDLPQTKEVINQFCSGSVRQSLSFKDFAAISVVLPPKEIAEAFARRWKELNALRQHLEVESTKLAEIGDTLLPKLMSGELRVPDELMA